MLIFSCHILGACYKTLVPDSDDIRLRGLDKVGTSSSRVIRTTRSHTAEVLFVSITLQIFESRNN